MGRPRILIVEDELLVAISMRTTIEALGLEVIGVAANCEDAMKWITDDLPDCVTLDYQLQDGNTANIAKFLTDKGVPFAIVSGNVCEMVKQLEVTPTVVLMKPFSSRALKDAITELLGEFDSPQRPD